MVKSGLMALAILVFSLSACFPQPAYAAKDAQAAQPSPVSQVMAKININDADLEQLESIRGVGPALAERIATYRKENGKFKTTEDLMKVRGIGQSKFDRIKGQLTV